jgi:hypothetical protein
MRERIARIKMKAEILWAHTPEDTLELDKELGELEMLVHEARCEIDAEWRALREIAFMSRQEGAMRKEPPSTTLQDLI